MILSFIRLQKSVSVRINGRMEEKEIRSRKESYHLGKTRNLLKWLLFERVGLSDIIISIEVKMMRICFCPV